MNNKFSDLVSISFIGNIAGKIFRYGIILAIARSLGQNALGIFSFGIVLMETASVIARFGMDTTVQRFVPKYLDESSPNKSLGLILLGISTTFIIGLFISLILTVFNSQLAKSAPAYSKETMLFIWAIPIYGVMIVSARSTQSFKDTRYFVYIREISQSGLALLGVLVGGFLIGDLYITSVLYLLSIVVGVVLAFIYLRNLISWNQEDSINIEVKKHFSYSVPFVLTAVSMHLISWSDTLMLGFFVPADQTGWYQSSYQTSILLLILLQAVNSIFPPVASGLYENNQITKLSRLYRGITKIISKVTVLGLIYVTLFAGSILQLFGTPPFEATFALILLSVGNTFAVITGPAGYLLSMADHEQVEFFNTVVINIFNVMGNLILIQKFGIAGAAAASAASLILLNLLRLWEINRYLGISPPIKDLSSVSLPLLGSIVILLVVYFIIPKTVPFILLAGAISLFCLLVLMYIQGLDEEELLILESVDRNL